jgi:hypothetical protein
LWDTERRKVLVSRNVLFDENLPMTLPTPTSPAVSKPPTLQHTFSIDDSDSEEEDQVPKEILPSNQQAPPIPIQPPLQSTRSNGLDSEGLRRSSRPPAPIDKEFYKIKNAHQYRNVFRPRIPLYLEFTLLQNENSHSRNNIDSVGEIGDGRGGLPSVGDQEEIDDVSFDERSLIPEKGLLIVKSISSNDSHNLVGANEVEEKGALNTNQPFDESTGPAISCKDLTRSDARISIGNDISLQFNEEAGWTNRLDYELNYNENALLTFALSTKSWHFRRSNELGRGNV